MKRKYRIAEVLFLNSFIFNKLSCAKSPGPDLTTINTRICDFSSIFIHTYIPLFFISLLPLSLTSPAFAQTAPTQPDPTALVRRAVQHRIDSANNHPLRQYLLRRIDERRDSTKAIIETVDGDVARLIAINGKPLAAEANTTELDRLKTLAEHPELEERRHRSEQKDAAQFTHLLSLLPNAFLYTSAGTVPCGAGQCYRLRFTPNPHFAPPDLEASVLRGLAGELWIDQAQEQLVKLDARFIADVDVGFGILGKLNKGGTAVLEQSHVGGDGDWELTSLKIHVTGKLLLVRSLRYQIDESTSHFTPVTPGLHYRDAINLLKQLDPSNPYAGLR